jgi:predicted kinase
MTQEPRPILIVFSGLPGTGKTTIAKLVAARLSSLYLRIDTIEQAMKAAGAERIGPAGYAVANALAEANLLLGHSVIADAVNAVRESRVGWREVAARALATLVNIHLVCSDAAEHRRRIEERFIDIPGLVRATWKDVSEQAFEPRDEDHLVLNTAILLPDELVDRCISYVSQNHGRAA